MTAVFIFIGFVGFMFWMSSILGRKTGSADGFFVAGGQIHWFVNGIALTGGYLSAASFLGICGMIAFEGFDGYLYSIGFLSGWVVALFVVAEPLRRLGKYTFADAIEARFESKAIHFAAGVSTLVICMCYMVPQLVGAGVLIEPLLGIPYYWGVIIVGAVVIVFVASAGMSSTTYVQFINAGMLLLFSGILVLAICMRGLSVSPDRVNARGQVVRHYSFAELPVDPDKSWDENLENTPYSFVDSIRKEYPDSGKAGRVWVLLSRWFPLKNDLEDRRVYHLSRKGQRLPVIRDPEGVVVDFLRGLPAYGFYGRVPAEFRGIVIQNLRVVEKVGLPYVQLESWWLLEEKADGGAFLRESQDITKCSLGGMLVNGLPAGRDNTLLPMGGISKFGAATGHGGEPGPITPFRLLSVFSDHGTEIELPVRDDIRHNGRDVTLYYHSTVPGNELMRPGGYFNLSGGGRGAGWILFLLCSRFSSGQRRSPMF